MCISGGESLYLSSGTPFITIVILQIGILLAPIGISASSFLKAVRRSDWVRYVSLTIAVAALTWLLVLFYWYTFQTNGCGGWLVTGISFTLLLAGYPAIILFWIAGQLCFFKIKAQERLDLYALFCILASIATFIFALLLAMQSK